MFCVSFYFIMEYNWLELPRWRSSGKEPTCQSRRHKRCEFSPWVGKIPQRMAWQPTPVFLPGESHGQRSLVGYSPWGWTESYTTELKRLSTHTLIADQQCDSFRCTAEGLSCTHTRIHSSPQFPSHPGSGGRAKNKMIVSSALIQVLT